MLSAVAASVWTTPTTLAAAGVDWTTVAAIAVAVAALWGSFLFPALVWVRRHGKTWMNDANRDVTSQVVAEVISEEVIPRFGSVEAHLTKVQDNVHKLRTEVSVVAGRVSYLEGLTAGRAEQRDIQVEQRHQRDTR